MATQTLRDTKVYINAQKKYLMRINPVRTLIVVSIAIIILYTLGLFLPIIKNTKQSKTQFFFEIEVVYILGKKIISL